MDRATETPDPADSPSDQLIREFPYDFPFRGCMMLNVICTTVIALGSGGVIGFLLWFSFG